MIAFANSANMLTRTRLTVYHDTIAVAVIPVATDLVVDREEVRRTSFASRGVEHHRGGLLSCKGVDEVILCQLRVNREPAFWGLVLVHLEERDCVVEDCRPGEARLPIVDKPFCPVRQT